MVRNRRIRNVVRTREEIDSVIEKNGHKYILIPNNIFDDFYEKKATVTRKVMEKNKDTGELEEKEKIEHFTELDMIVYIFLQFISKNKITTNKNRIAEYLDCSSKQLSVSLKKLRLYEGKINARYNPYHNVVDIIEETVEPLITEKSYLAYNPKTKKRKQALHWFVNYIPYYKIKKKKDKEVAVAVNFFMVTFDDLQLLLDGTLTRNEFVTYLWLLRVYKYGATHDGQMWWSYSKIAERLNYKLPETIQNHIEKLLEIKIDDIPLLEEIRPDNYDLKLLQGEEPSAKFIPIYNPSKMMEMDFGKEEVNSENEEVNFKIAEVSLEKEEMDFEKAEALFG
ncbi:hypothetical protein P9E34_19735 [Schinkia azotoformans]|uniref:hypothetical protein n=1 Tax=Schinkia azotoformans TaxID=1454 RepID=UPI002DBA7C5D|nr:hypothetical protein [Schinkia azotoformans]MEC1726943.1 hypothetical protein [Schinkia azotoformans]